LARLTENRVVKLWERVAGSGKELLTIDRSPVRVLYPGRHSDIPGADFQDAVVEIGGRVERGNIEVHVREEDWRTHGHHRDPSYNGVVLHVVMWRGGLELTPLENGGRVPVVALDGQGGGRASGGRPRSPGLPCGGRRGREAIVAIVDCAGDARFGERVATFTGELKGADIGQGLYAGIMGALGYSRNQVPFRAVAERVPLAALEQATGGEDEGETLAGLEALLLGTAGFLPSQRAAASAELDPWVEAVETAWRSRGPPASGRLPWSLFRVRPSNHPARRLAGMARLLRRFRQTGLLPGLASVVENADEHDPGASLMVAADGYWADHFDLGGECAGLERYLIGRSRAGEIAVNVVLPFAAALGQATSRGGLARRAMDLYADQPPAAENAVGRHMRLQLGLKPPAVNTARRQQGLLHLYKRYCTQGRCAECELGG